MSKNLGFTLIELIIVLVIMAIISLFSLVSFNQTNQNTQLQLMADEIENAIRYAKLMSLATDSTLVLKPLVDKNEWSQGLILFKDGSGHKYSNNAQLIHQWQWKKNNIHVTWHGFLSSSYLLFSPNLRHAALSGKFEIFNNQKIITISLNRLGHLRRSEPYKNEMVKLLPLNAAS